MIFASRLDVGDGLPVTGAFAHGSKECGEAWKGVFFDGLDDHALIECGRQVPLGEHPVLDDMFARGSFREYHAHRWFVVFGTSEHVIAARIELPSRFVRNVLFAH